MGKNKYIDVFGDPGDVSMDVHNYRLKINGTSSLDLFKIIKDKKEGTKSDIPEKFEAIMEYGRKEAEEIEAEISDLFETFLALAEARLIKFNKEIVDKIKAQ